MLARNLRIYILIISLIRWASANGQTTDFSQYTDSSHRFSFDLPSHWKIKYSTEQGGMICVPTTPKGNEIYQDCFEGIVFRIEIVNASLDYALSRDGDYNKVGEAYHTRDRFDSLVAKNIRGRGWTGIYHLNHCGIDCKSTGFHAAAGSCEFIYFSNGRTTVLIDTNGAAFEDDVRARIVSSFAFY